MPPGDKTNPFDDPLYDQPKEDKDKQTTPKISIGEQIAQYLVQGDSPYREDYDINKDGKLSIQDTLWAQQIDKGLRDPNTLEAIQQGQPDPTTPTETFLNPDGTLKEEYLKQVTEQMGSAPYFQSLMGEQPDLSGYAQTGDVDTAIAAALAGQAGPDLSGYAQTGDMDAAIAAAMQGFNIDDQLRDAMEVWGKDFMPNTDLSQYMTADVVQKMIDDGLANGMSAEAVLEMIEEYGGPMDPAEIQQMIADSQASLESLGGLTEAEIQKMITEGLANGMTPEQNLF